MLRTGSIEIAQISTSELRYLDDLMIRYSDRPMDFADATLVYIAQRERIQTILTIDHDDFETYRIGRRTSFRILPPRGARSSR